MARRVIQVALVLALFAVEGRAQTRYWVGAGTGDWFSAANWNPSDSAPQAGESVVITGGTVRLTNATPWLDRVTVVSATLLFAGWTSVLCGSDVDLGTGAVLTLPPAFAATSMPNRIWVACTSFTLRAGAALNADGRGYDVAVGPGAGQTYGSRGAGGGHGGRGGDSNGGLGQGGLTNDSLAAALPGSGGGYGHSSGVGGAGGGAVRIDAAGTAWIDGVVSARGALSGWYGGGGAGGSIALTCGTLAGTTGVLRVDGGKGGWANDICGAGGGGRMACAYSALDADCAVRFSAAEGGAEYSGAPAGMGTLLLPDVRLIENGRLAALFSKVRVVIPGIASWSVDSLTLTNAVGLGDETAFVLTVTNTLTLRPGGWLTVGGIPLSDYQSWPLVSGAATTAWLRVGGALDLRGGALNLGGKGQSGFGMLDVGGALAMTNASRLTVYGGETNAVFTNGALVQVTGESSLAAGCWILVWSQPVNGGSPRFDLRDLLVATNAGFRADAAGFKSEGTAVYGYGRGLSAGNRGGGAGHGGTGGVGAVAGAWGGATYGRATAPVHAGSGGGYGYAPQPGNSWGGGSVQILASNVLLHGTISANARPPDTQYGGGGSGGSIFITCETFTGGPSAVVRADGANGGTVAGGGGGGRIAIGVGVSPDVRDQLVRGESVAGLTAYYSHTPFAGTISVARGIGGYTPAAESGTRTFLTVNRVILTVLGVPGNYGRPGPQGYGTTIDLPAGAWVTNAVASPADETGGLRRACVGWTLTNRSGSVSSGGGFETGFALSEDLFLTWYWTNEYLLSVATGINGSASSDLSGWYTNGVDVSGITAAPAVGYSFLRWFGDVPEDLTTQRVIALTMDRPRAIRATFVSTGMGTRVWSGVGAWESETNWAPVGIPGGGEDVLIRTGTVVLAHSRRVRSLVVSNGASLYCTNWTTVLRAEGAVTVRSNGAVTLPPAFVAGQPASNRIRIVCGRLVVHAGGRIDANACGWASATGDGRGYGGSSNDGSGAGHGGRGGSNTSFSAVVAGRTYDSSNAPALPGSGGGGGYVLSGYQGAGGGVIVVEAAGDVVVDGTVRANGQQGGSYWGGGSGGSVLIMCGGVLSGGTNGLISVQGGDRGGGYVSLGGGGGGRIAIWEKTMESVREQILAGDLKGVQPEERATYYSGRLTAAGGTGGENGWPGTIVYLRGLPQPGALIQVW